MHIINNDRNSKYYRKNPNRWNSWRVWISLLWTDHRHKFKQSRWWSN